MEPNIHSLDIDQVFQYMQCPPEKADDLLRAKVEVCAKQLLKTARPRWIYRTFEIQHTQQGVELQNGILLPGQSIRTHLQGCEKAVLFSATLSAGVDALIRKAQSVDMLEALALDCCATVAIETFCDQIEEEIHTQFSGCFFPFRFSPGYGDLPITLQGAWLNLLDAPRRIGLCASANHILTPRKSVTAVIGVSRQPVAQETKSCLSCLAQHNCQYRKAGGHCGIS